jgi:hypothetical protein
MATADVQPRNSPARDRLQRLATAVAGGADVSTLVEGMRTREERCPELRLQLQIVRRRPVFDVQAVIDDLRVRLSDCRDLLRSSIPEARTLLRLLIVDRLSMEPTPKGYPFSGLGTVVAILEAAGLPTARFEWRPKATRIGTRSTPSSGRWPGCGRSPTGRLTWLSNTLGGLSRHRDSSPRQAWNRRRGTACSTPLHSCARRRLGV